MNIIINGGTRGIGKELVMILSQDKNNKVLVTGRNNQSLAALTDRFHNVISFTLDIANYSAYNVSFMKFIKTEFDHIDVLINMAGYLVNKPFLEINSEETMLMMKTNFFGPVSLIKAIKPFMHEGSHILNISSMGGFQGSVKFNGLSYYSASKAALTCITECLATEFAPDLISVNCLCLGAVQTEMLNEAFPGYKAPVSPVEMAEYIADFAIRGHKFFNGKILPVAVSTP